MSDNGTMHVVTFSGGIGSWAAAKLAAEEHGARNVVLLFADTRMEDPDLYRFLVEAAENVGSPLVRISEGRTPWQVFFDEKFLGNSRLDPCSRILKRQILDRWIEEHCERETAVIYVGIDCTEEHRFVALRDRRLAQGWTYRAPLCDRSMDKLDVFSWLKREGIRRPRLYDLGFAHNNCGGFCVKAGHGQFATLLRELPDLYRHHEEQEEKLRAEIGKDVSILTDRRGDGVKKPLTLSAFRRRVERREPIDMFSISTTVGSCSCMSDPSEGQSLTPPAPVSDNDGCDAPVSEKENCDG